MRNVAVLLLLLPVSPAFPASPFVEGQAILSSAQAYDPFGMRAAALPDLDGDGIEDFALGSLSLPENGGVTLNSGASGAELRRLVPIGSFTLYPNAVADAGDVDFDGSNDIAVGTAGGSFDGSRGAVRFYAGSDGHLVGMLAGTVNGARFGAPMAGIGDVDGDGAGDLLVGAPNYQARGRVYLVSGATRSVIREFEAPEGARSFGAALTRLGDIDGDRQDDFGVGAPAIDTNLPRHAYTWSPRADAPIATLTGGADSPAFGARLSAAGDFNRDGDADLAILDSVAGGTIREGGPGRAIVVDGGSGALLYTRQGGNSQSEMGRGGAAADVDGDGHDDWFVAAKEGAAMNAGSLAILSGPDGAELARYTNTVARDRLFNDVAPLGDVDGDGRLDFLATTFGQDASRAYVVAGTVARGGALTVPVGGHTGIWYDPAHSGEGFVLEVYADGRATVYWFTYDAGGRQRYLVGTGARVGPRIVVDALYDTAGGRLGGQFEPAAVQLRDRSQLVLAFDGCDRGYAEYTVDGDRWHQRLVRLSGIPGASCGGSAPRRFDLSGSWYDAAHPGEGWVVQQVDATHAVVIWFTYDDGGAQQWFVATANLATDELVASDVLRPAGGRFGRYFRADEVVRPAWGTLRMRFGGCDTATVSWTHDGIDGTAASVVRLTAPAAVACVR